ncbi:serine-threonine protein kinase [Colletotrichum asianum]|uniref:Serine-threonine protein kinase n=1 Tax=Colletotrichum asianum TaxID=702518 RepID=A0A8H3WED4_9PEZI|nr:serine-threonine protein kinase [Colletotrichum asianum]
MSSIPRPTETAGKQPKSAPVRRTAGKLGPATGLNSAPKGRTGGRKGGHIRYGAPGLTTLTTNGFLRRSFKLAGPSLPPS